MIQITDLETASFLRASGIELLEVRRNPNRKQVIFIFPDTTEVKNLIDSLELQTATVSVSAIFEAQKSLRAIIYR